MDINSLKVDPVAITEGRWIGDLPGMGDLRVRVRGMSSPVVAELQARKLRALAPTDRDRDGRPTFAAATRIDGEVLAEAVLLDWQGITNGAETVPYDAALARKWLTDPAYARFAQAVSIAASYVDAAKAEMAATVPGN